MSACTVVKITKSAKRRAIAVLIKLIDAVKTAGAVCGFEPQHKVGVLRRDIQHSKRHRHGDTIVIPRKRHGADERGIRQVITGTVGRYPSRFYWPALLCVRAGIPPYAI